LAAESFVASAAKYVEELLGEEQVEEGHEQVAPLERAREALRLASRELVRVRSVAPTRAQVARDFPPDEEAPPAALRPAPLPSEFLLRAGLAQQRGEPTAFERRVLVGAAGVRAVWPDGRRAAAEIHAHVLLGATPGEPLHRAAERFGGTDSLSGRLEAAFELLHGLLVADPENAVVDLATAAELCSEAAERGRASTTRLDLEPLGRLLLRCGVLRHGLTAAWYGVVWAYVVVQRGGAETLVRSHFAIPTVKPPPATGPRMRLRLKQLLAPAEAGAGPAEAQLPKEQLAAFVSVQEVLGLWLRPVPLLPNLPTPRPVRSASRAARGPPPATPPRGDPRPRLSTPAQYSQGSRYEIEDELGAAARAMPAAPAPPFDVEAEEAVGQPEWRPWMVGILLEEVFMAGSRQGGAQGQWPDAATAVTGAMAQVRHGRVTVNVAEQRRSAADMPEKGDPPPDLRWADPSECEWHDATKAYVATVRSLVLDRLRVEAGRTRYVPAPEHNELGRKAEVDAIVYDELNGRRPP